MSSIRFYLDRASAKLTKAKQPDRAVFLRYKRGKESFVLYPGVVVATSEWDVTTNRLSGRGLRAQQLNADLSRAENDLRQIEKNLRAGLNGAAPTLHQIQLEAWKLYPPRRGENARILAAEQQRERKVQRQQLLDNQAAPTLLDALDWFTRTRQLELQKGTLETYQSLRNNLVQYAQTFLPVHSLQLPELNREFYTGFRAFLLTVEFKPGKFYVNNTVNTRLKRVRTVLNEVMTDGPDHLRRHVNQEYRHFKLVKTPKGQHLPSKPSLSAREIILFYRWQFDHRSGRLARARDLYVFSYMTSLRLSDLPLVKPQHIVSRFVPAPSGELVETVELCLPMTQKNRKALVIPLNQIALEILARYRGKYPQSLPVIDRDTASRYVREGMRRTGYFDDQVELIRLHNKERVTCVMPRYQALTFHTSRHGFATFLATEQVDMEDAQLLLGHSQLRTTQIYYHRLPQDASQRVLPVLRQLDEAYFTMAEPTEPVEPESGNSTPLSLAQARRADKYP